MTSRLFAACVLMLAVAVSAFAQQPPQAATDGFIPLSEMANREVLPATPLVFYAYAFVWVAVLAYLWSIWTRMQKVQRDINDLRRRVEGQGPR